MQFFNNLSEQFNLSLDKQQQEAVKHVDGPTLVLAGPGSGKTTVIISRTAYLVMEAGIKPDNILTVTFNRAAGCEMKQRFKNVFGSHINEKVHFSTIHSFCNSVLRHYEKIRGKELKRIEGSEHTAENKKRILQNIYYELNGSSINDDELENLLGELSLVKNTMCKDFDGESFSTRNFNSIFRAYEDYKKANLLVDFDDMLTYAFSILKKFPYLLESYRRRYSYIQIDEGQDLSTIQFEIIKLLAGAHNNVFIVADDDQSIYGFRGSDPKHILEIEKSFPGSKLYYLENNYRSAGNIVDISSRFIKQNCKRYDKSHKPVNIYAKDPVVVQPRDENSQLKFLVDTVKALTAKTSKTVGILFRNNLSSITIADAFNRNNILFSLRQNRLFFFNHWAVIDIMSFLKFALDQRDVDSFQRICFKMNRFLSKAMLEHALSLEISESVIDNLLSFNELKPFQINRIEGIKIEFKRLAKMSTEAALCYIENDFKYFESIKEYCEITGISFEYVYRLFGVLKTLATSYPYIPAFIDRIEALEDLIAGHTGHSSGSMVTLSTIHSSKGLEYDCVIMTDLTDNEIPGRKAIEKAKDDSRMIEEERRLFYVGMTRAKEDLYLVSPQYVNGMQASKSIFISELSGIMNMGKAVGIREGSIVYHKHFGKGTVTAVLENSCDKITIETDFMGIRRKLDLLTCLDNGIINVANDKICTAL